VRRTAPVRVDRHEPEDRSTRGLGDAALVGVPVHVGATMWGVMTAVSRRPCAFAAGSEARLQDSAELIGTFER
jgi:transcriptional regulator with GAF, ATPase, and Fis domain